MIIKLICEPFFLLIDGVIALMPVLTYIPTSIVDTVSLLLKAMQFFPVDVWIMAIGNIIFWVLLHFTISLIKFIVSWIPFINMGG